MSGRTLFAYPVTIASRAVHARRAYQAGRSERGSRSAGRPLSASLAPGSQGTRSQTLRDRAGPAPGRRLNFPAPPAATPRAVIPGCLPAVPAMSGISPYPPRDLTGKLRSSCKQISSCKKSTCQARFSFALYKVFPLYGIYLLIPAGRNGQGMPSVPRAPDVASAPSCPGALGTGRRSLASRDRPYGEISGVSCAGQHTLFGNRHGGGPTARTGDPCLLSRRPLSAYPVTIVCLPGDHDHLLCLADDHDHVRFAANGRTLDAGGQLTGRLVRPVLALGTRGPIELYRGPKGPERAWPAGA
jgi:hypothetical protein